MKPDTILVRQGDILQNKGLYEEAAECYIRAIAMDSSHVHAYVRLGCVWLHQNKFNDVAVIYRKALTFDRLEPAELQQIACFIKTSARFEVLHDELHAQLVDAFIDRVLSKVVLGLGANTHEMAAVWDFRSQPYSIGDVILLYQVVNFLSFVRGIPHVKMLLIADPLEPARQSFVKLGVNAENYLDHIIKLLPVFMLGEKVTSLAIERSEEVALKEIADQSAVVWPPAELVVSGIDLNNLSFKLLNMLYEKYSVMPDLEIRKSLSQWAADFIIQKGEGRIAIAVQIRNTHSYNLSRNSNMAAWLELFEYSEKSLPVTFFVICAASEIDDRLRSRKNVVVAKDYRTTVDQDMALVKECSAFLGVSSGPGTIAFFGRKPYSIVNAHIMEGMLPHLKKEEWGYSFVYATENQRIIASGTEHFELLVKELEMLVAGASIDCKSNNSGAFGNYMSELRLD